MRQRPVTLCLTLALLFILPLLALSQAAPPNLILNLNGHQSQVPITQMNGRSYVDVEALARAANGTISFQGKQTVLTFQGTNSSTSAASTDQGTPPATPGFSKDFMRAAIEAMAAIREWRSVLTTGVQKGYPVPDLGLTNYRAQASQSLRLAGVAATTDADHSAFQLVTNEFNNMRTLS